jgi:hypothetical protein
MRTFSTTQKTIQVAFALLLFLGIILSFAVRSQTSKPDRKLTFVGFTNVAGTNCGMFKFPGWYTPPRWVPHGSSSLCPEAHFQSDNGDSFAPILEMLPKVSTGFPATFIYAVAVPPGSTTMHVRIEERVNDSIRLGIQIPFKEKSVRATSDVVQIPIDFQAPADRALSNPSALPSL